MNESEGWEDFTQEWRLKFIVMARAFGTKRKNKWKAMTRRMVR
jgi:hypothetical protein